MAQCDVCFHRCTLSEGRRGFCGARRNVGGTIVAENYGRITALALDPIEKKPLRRFHPGSRILSVGSYGCNLRCPFCQNSEISWSDAAKRYAESTQVTTPAQLVRAAQAQRLKGNIGLAFTYNEPLVGWEYVRDAARLSREAGMVNVLVTNGTANLSVLEAIAPYIDAMNIDLKGFTERYYNRVLGGDFHMVRAFIASAVQRCHVELTTLIVPGENDDEHEMRALSAWVAGLMNARGEVIGAQIPLHVTRFFPHFHMKDRLPTDIRTVYRLAGVARENLEYVYTGNC